MKFEEYWCKYGRYHAEACGSNSRLFAQEIWDGAIQAALELFLEAKEQEFLEEMQKRDKQQDELREG